VPRACRAGDVDDRRSASESRPMRDLGHQSRLRQLRIGRGLTQQALADLAQLDLRTVQRIERGRPASLRALWRLADALDQDIAALQHALAGMPPHGSSDVLTPSRGRAILVGSPKAGTGRTTLAVSLAGLLIADARTVCLVDLSTINGTHLFMSWAMTLRQPVPAHRTISCPTLAASGLPALRATHDYVVIDGSGFEDAEISPMVLAADQTLVTTDNPCMDFGNQHRLAMWLDLARVANVAVAHVRASRHSADRARDRRRLEALGFPLLQTTLVKRVAYERAITHGRTVVQHDPTGLAAYELRCLAKEIGVLQGEAPPHVGRDRRPSQRDRAFVRATIEHCFTAARLRRPRA